MPPGFDKALIALALVFLLSYLIRLTKNPRVRGLIGEKATDLGLWAALDKSEYHRFPNLMLPTNRGGLTQIDHVILSPYGVFVVETKDYKGWIFGEAKSAQWTVTYRSGRKYKFQNPLRQNHAHVKAVEEWLGVPSSTVHGLVFFVGDASFKTAIPDGVFLRGLASEIKAYRDRVFDPPTIERLKLRLQEARAMDSPEQRRRHLSSVRQRKQP